MRIHKALVVLAVIFTISCLSIPMFGNKVERQRMFGVAYGPYRDGQQPWGNCPTDTQINEDLSILCRFTNVIRTYGLRDGCDLAERVMSAAQLHDVRVVLGMWLNGDEIHDDGEFTELERLVENGLNDIPALVVGNETLLRNDLSIDELISNIERAREIVGPNIPITTAEPWHIWLSDDGAELVEHCDVIFAHIHPFLELPPQHIDNAVDFAFDRVDDLRDAYELPIVVAETGWPSAGDPNDAAVPSQENFEKYFDEFVCRARDERQRFIWFSFRNEKWKIQYEGEIGGNWGLFDEANQRKIKTIPLCP